MDARKWAPAVAAIALLGGTTFAVGCGASADTAGTGAGADQNASPATDAATSESPAGDSGVWDSCPKGRSDDPYPGECDRYADTNDDGICDLSQSNPSASSSAISLASDTATAVDPSTGGCPLGPCAVCGICVSLSQV